MLQAMFEQLIDKTPCRSQIAAEESHMTCALSQSKSQRHPVTNMGGFFDHATSFGQRLIGKSLSPKKFCEQCARDDAGIKLKAGDVRPILRPGIMTQHRFSMLPRTGMVAEIKQRHSDGTFA